MVQPAVPGLSIADDKGVIMKHCSYKCLETYSKESVSLPVHVIKPPLRMEITPLCILSASKMVEFRDDVIAKVTLNLCLNDISMDDRRTPMLLVHIRTHLSQHFLEFSINEKLQVTQVPPYLSTTVAKDIINQLETAGILKQVLHPALLQLGYTGLSTFLMYVLKALNE